MAIKGLTGTPIHQGAWFGLPDFGITEKIQQTFTPSKGYTSQGGSNLYQSSKPKTSTGDVYGSFTNVPYDTSAGLTDTRPVQGPAQVPGASQPKTGIGTPTFTPPAIPNDLGAINAGINDVYQPQLNYLNQAENTLRASFPNVLSEAEAAFNTSVSGLNQRKEAANKELEAQGQAAFNRKQDVLGAARRMYDELRRGYGQRFGGASSAGEAAYELAGIEQQKQSGQTQRQYGDTLAAIGRQKTDLENQYNTNVMQLESQKQSTINQANRDFQQQLLSITQSRAQAEGVKAEARLNALNDLRNKIYEANNYAAQVKAQLDSQRQQAFASLDSFANTAVSNAQGATQAFNMGTTTSPQSGLAMGQNPVSGVNPYIGAISGRRPEDYLIG